MHLYDFIRSMPAAIFSYHQLINKINDFVFLGHSNTMPNMSHNFNIYAVTPNFLSLNNTLRNGYTITYIEMKHLFVLVVKMLHLL